MWSWWDDVLGAFGQPEQEYVRDDDYIARRGSFYTGMPDPMPFFLGRPASAPERVEPAAYRVESRGPGYEILAPLALKGGTMFGSEASARSDLDRAGMLYSADTDSYYPGGYWPASSPLTAYNAELGNLTNASANLFALNNPFRIPPMFNIGMPTKSAAPAASGIFGGSLLLALAVAAGVLLLLRR